MALHMLLPHLSPGPAAHRPVQISPSIAVTQCSHAACTRNKSSHLMPSGISPFTPFAASAVSNTAFVGSNEEYQETFPLRLEAVAIFSVAGFILTGAMFLWPDYIWPYLCSECQKLGKWREWSTWRDYAEHTLREFVLSNAFGAVMKAAMVHLSLEHLEHPRQVFDQLFQSLCNGDA